MLSNYNNNFGSVVAASLTKQSSVTRNNSVKFYNRNNVQNSHLLICINFDQLGVV